MFNLRKWDKPRLKRSGKAAAVILCVGSALLAGIAFAHPTNYLETVETGKIEQTFSMAYKADVIPCVLYPEGGVIEPEGRLPRSMLRGLVFDMRATVDAGETVQVDGQFALDAVITSEGYWERTFPITGETAFSLSGAHNTLLDGRFHVDITSLFGFIDQVVEETGVSFGQYTLTVEPHISGVAQSAGIQAPIADPAGFTFDISGNTVALLPDQSGEAGDHYRETSQSTPALRSEILPQTLELAGVSMPVATARAVFGGLTLVFAALWLPGFVVKRIRCSEGRSEAQKIDKKHGKRIFSLHMSSQDTGKPEFMLASFSDLVRLSDEKVLPIFRVERPDAPCYILIDAHHMYSYAPQPGAHILSATKPGRAAV